VQGKVAKAGAGQPEAEADAEAGRLALADEGAAELKTLDGGCDDATADDGAALEAAALLTTADDGAWLETTAGELLGAAVLTAIEDAETQVLTASCGHELDWPVRMTPAAS
jgi:hypothetical protein